MRLDLALYQPEIAQNTGTMLRFGACMNIKIHVIHPCAYPFSVKELKRSAMDYFDHVDLQEHNSFEQYKAWEKSQNRRTILLSTAATDTFTHFEFQPNDILMVGRESSGVDLVHAQQCAHMVRIPMAPSMRSLNVAVSAAMVMTEAMRQTNQFKGLK